MTAIVIVEDYGAYRRALRMMIDDAFPGVIRFRMCVSGSEALLAIRSGEKWDIGLVDINLGDVQGERVIEELRNSNHGMKIAVVTGAALHNEAFQRVKVFADEVMTKDQASEHLIPLLEQWIGMGAQS